MPKYSKLSSRARKKLRDEFVKSQNSLCLFCLCSLNHPPPEEIRTVPINWKLFPPHFTKYPVHLHHDHDTDECIGAVHSYCNAVLWQYFGS